MIARLPGLLLRRRAKIAPAIEGTETRRKMTNTSRARGMIAVDGYTCDFVRPQWNLRQFLSSRSNSCQALVCLVADDA